MTPNFKRQPNRLQFAAILRGVIITVFLAVAGLSYVYLKHQLYVCGNQRKDLEHELNELISENNVMETQISNLTSRAALQRRLDDGSLNLVPISNQALVRVHPQDSNRWLTDARRADSQIQTIAHEQVTRR